jgi:GTPase SAR1 family protein
VPAVDDIVRTRQATTGIHEYAFDIQDKNIMFRMIDVGGQRSERRKWIHCFEHVTSIIFIVASSEYDQHLVEDVNMNRMEESVALFQTIVQYQWFRKATFILFLNKMDLLEEKVTGGKCEFKKFFSKSPEPYNTPFEGDSASVTDVTRFITTMYEERAYEEEDATAAGGVKKGKVYTHSTQATDTDQIEKIFSGVKKTIMANALSSYNIT